MMSDFISWQIHRLSFSKALTPFLLFLLKYFKLIYLFSTSRPDLMWIFALGPSLHYKSSLATSSTCRHVFFSSDSKYLLYSTQAVKFIWCKTHDATHTHTQMWEKSRHTCLFIQYPSKILYLGLEGWLITDREFSCSLDKQKTKTLWIQLHVLHFTHMYQMKSWRLSRSLQQSWALLMFYCIEWVRPSLHKLPPPKNNP